MSDGADPPGTPLIDIHCHGAAGATFGADADAARRIAAAHRSDGVARVVASLVTAETDRLANQVAVLAPLVSEGVLAGIHLEGPFLSGVRCGAQNPDLLMLPDVEVVHRLADAAIDQPGAIVQWTVAPELPGWWAAAEAMIERGIQPSLGHTDADAVTMERALGAIAERTGRPALVTHLFNAMPPIHHRAGGAAVGALAAAGRGEAIVELIVDGVHLDPAVVRMVFDTVGADSIALVSDAMAAAGKGDGRYALGSMEVDVVDGVARLADGAIAGSTSTLSQCVEHAVGVASVPSADAIVAASLTPIRALGLG